MKAKLAPLFVYSITALAVGSVLATGAIALMRQEPEPPENAEVEVEVPSLAMPEVAPLTDKVQLNSTDTTDTASVSSGVVRDAVASASTVEPASPSAVPIIVTWMDYVDAYRGLCPHEQPQESPFWRWHQWLAAVGANTDHYSVEHVIEMYWEAYRRGDANMPSGETSIDNFWNLGLAPVGDRVTYGAALYMNYSTLEVYWDASNPNNRPYIPGVADTYPPEWDTIAANAQVYLRYLENTYNSHCPND